MASVFNVLNRLKLYSIKDWEVWTVGGRGRRNERDVLIRMIVQRLLDS